MIELWHGTTKALIDPIGVWVTNLSDDNGDILFPKRVLVAADGTKKQRGGCHVCLPNFGPGGNSNMPQHGFGRTCLWAVEAQRADNVTVRLAGGAAGYEQLESRIDYSLPASNEFVAHLTVANNGSEPLRVAPGFHPYFALADNEQQLTIGGVAGHIDDFADMVLAPGHDTMALSTAKRTLTLRSKNLPDWAQWSDQLGSYFCLEPTAAGYAFENNRAADLLAPGESRAYHFTISW